MKVIPQGIRRTSYIAVSALLVASPAWAQQAPEQAPAPADVSEDAAPQTPAAASASPATPDIIPTSEQSARTPERSLGPIFVEVTNEGFSVTPQEVATAIARELGVALSSNPQLARGTFEVKLKRGRDVSVTYRDVSGNELSRVVRAPENDGQVLEVTALLAVNLSHDKSAEVLAGLVPATPVPESPAAQSASPAPVTPDATEPPTALPYVWGNATFVYPLTVVRDVEQRTVGAELGLLYSDIGASGGVALNPLVLRVRHSSEGVLIAGVGTVSGDPDDAKTDQAVRLAGAFNYGNAPLDGLSVAGAVDILAQADGAGRSLDGGQISGAVNIAAGDVDGMQLAGAVNYAGSTSGAQIGGAVNIARGYVEGAQISGALNVAGDVTGAQIGIINIGKRVSGAQIGVINIADEVDGASIGVITYSKRGRTQLTTWFDSTRPVNVGARFVSGVLYAMPMVGGDPTKSDEFDYGLSLGARIPLDRVYVDVEGNSSQHFADGKVDESAVDLRYRVSVGVHVLPWLGVFAGGGVRHQFHAKDGGEHDVGPLWNAGIDLF